jgi:ribosomal protein S18 acetylase RimI-like enzyme
VTEKRPSQILRPATARPRGTAAAAAAEQAPPTPAELRAIEQGLVELPRHSGASVDHQPELAAVLALLRGRGPGYTFWGCPRWSASETPARLQAIDRRMRRLGEWPALLVADGVSQPANLVELLAQADWVEIEGERVMWTRLAPGVPHLDPALRIEAVTARSAAVYEAVEREVFGLPADFAGQRTASLANSIEAGSLRAYLLRLNGQPVATARLARGDGVAGLFGVGVVEHARRQGLGTLVTAVATRAGLAAGSSLVWLSVNEANAPALAVYRRLGFQPGLHWTRWLAPNI